MEKRVAVFVLAAFVLGLATKCYRDTHPLPVPLKSNLGRPGPTSVTPPRKRTRKPARTEELKPSDPALEHEQEKE